LNHDNALILQQAIFQVSFLDISKSLLDNSIIKNSNNTKLSTTSVSSWGVTSYISALLSKIIDPYEDGRYIESKSTIKTGSVYDAEYFKIRISLLYNDLVAKNEWFKVDPLTTSIKSSQSVFFPSALMDYRTTEYLAEKTIGQRFFSDESPFYIGKGDNSFFINCNYYQLSLFIIIFSNLVFAYPKSIQTNGSIQPYPFPTLPILGTSFLHYYITLPSEICGRLYEQAIPIKETWANSKNNYSNEISHLFEDDDIEKLRVFEDITVYIDNFDSQSISDNYKVHLFLTSGFTKNILQLNESMAHEIGYHFIEKIYKL